jgi:hypothetical protein
MSREYSAVAADGGIAGSGCDPCDVLAALFLRRQAHFTGALSNGRKYSGAFAPTVAAG